ncbi:MAG: hypothetical protein U1F43_31530 [Myxococcota bacterium]
MHGPTCGEEPAPSDACSTHFDCYPERVCARWRSDGDAHCSAPCGSSAECAQGEVCEKLPGGANVGFCEPAPSGLVASGGACSSDAGCAAGACVDGVCRATCFSEGACAASGESCAIAMHDGVPRAASACAPAGGRLPVGALCTPDGGQSWNGAACASGHCDLMPYPSSMVLPCAALCGAEADCGGQEECAVVVYGEAAAAAAMPFHPQLAPPTHDAVSACFTPPIPGGTKLEGEPCAAPEECRSDKCLHLAPGDAQRYCSALCSDDDQCPSDMRCKLDTLTLASPWFQSPYIDAQAPAPSAWTLVRVCKFE